MDFTGFLVYTDFLVYSGFIVYTGFYLFSGLIWLEFDISLVSDGGKLGTCKRKDKCITPRPACSAAGKKKYHQQVQNTEGAGSLEYTSLSTSGDSTLSLSPFLFFLYYSPHILRLVRCENCIVGGCEAKWILTETCGKLYLPEFDGFSKELFYLLVHLKVPINFSLRHEDWDVATQGIVVIVNVALDGFVIMIVSCFLHLLCVLS